MRKAIADSIASMNTKAERNLKLELRTIEKAPQASLKKIQTDQNSDQQALENARVSSLYAIAIVQTLPAISASLKLDTDICEEQRRIKSRLTGSGCSADPLPPTISQPTYLSAGTCKCATDLTVYHYPGPSSRLR